VGGCQRVRGTATGWQRDGTASFETELVIFVQQKVFALKLNNYSE